MFGSNKIKEELKRLIIKADALGLPQKDLDIAAEYLRYNEPAIGLDHIAVQLFEFDIKIDQDCYDKIMQISALLNIPPDEYNYITTLVTLQFPNFLTGPYNKINQIVSQDPMIEFT